MMFSKSLFAFTILLALSTHVHGHAAISPVLGVAGTPVRNDVQRPSAGAECGTTNVAETINTSTAIPLVNNAFTTTITNFDSGQDGSTHVTVQVDTTATGKIFTAVTVTQNGVLAPPAAGSAQITVSLPANTKCTGGAAGNLCLVSFTTAVGFGNCIVVSQGDAAASSAVATDVATVVASAVATDATDAAVSVSASTVTSAVSVAATDIATAVVVSAAATSPTAAAAGDAAKAHKHHKHGKHAGKKAAGARAARSLLAELGHKRDDVPVAKRSVLGWIWA